MAEERQASYVLARRSFCGATKENEGKEKKKKTFTRPVASQNEPSGCSSKLAEKVRGEIFDFVSFPESYIILQVCSDGTTRWLLQGSGI